MQQMLETSKIPSSLLLIHATHDDALSLAKAILEKASMGTSHEAKINSGNHPDLHIYLPDGKNRLHPMAAMQKMIKEMALPPFEAPIKIFIIEEAEKMLPPSSNALLKTLEEPPQDTYFLLLTEHPNRLLPTICSRLHPLSFARPEYASLDLSIYFALAEQNKWDELLDSFTAIEEVDPEILLNSCLDFASAQKDSKLFLKMARLVEYGKNALAHNIKIQTIFLNILLQMYT